MPFSAHSLAASVLEVLFLQPVVTCASGRQASGWSANNPSGQRMIPQLGMFTFPIQLQA